MEEIIKVEKCFEYEPGFEYEPDYKTINNESGEIYIDDYQLNLENLYKIREKVGIVFQNPDNQFIGATVRDDIAFGLENICVPREQMDELINRYSKVVRMENFWIMNQLNCPVVKNKELRLQVF